MMILCTNIIIFSVVCDVFASGFGGNCLRASTGIPSSVQTELDNNTPYDLLKSNLQIMDCSDRGEQRINICIKQSPGSTNCDSLTMGVDSSFILGANTQNPDLTNQYLRDLRLSVEYKSPPSCRCTRRAPSGTSVWTCVREECSGDICIMMPTPMGKMPLICKHVRSINRNDLQYAAIPGTCRVTAPSCDGTEVSQSLFSFSGPAIQCLTDTLRQNFYDNQPGCTGTNVDMAFLAKFGKFQEALRTSVRALLIMYVIGFGFKIILNHQEFNLEKVVMFVMKMLLVLYFSVGLGPAYFSSSGVKTTHNGMTEWVLPIVTQTASDFALMTFNAGGTSNGLCNFDDNNYPTGYKYFGLWDRIDCKFGAYFFIKKIYGFGQYSRSAGKNVGDSICGGYRLSAIQSMPDTDPFVLGLSGSDDSSDNTPTRRSNTNNSARAAAEDGSQVAVLFIIFKLFLGGGVVIAFALVYFIIIIIAIVLGFLSLYTVCLVTLHVLIYLAPIFVPFALFERTKSYFDAWVGLIISYTLQPMILACAIGFCMSMFDEVMFGSCQFQRVEYTNDIRTYATFEMRIPDDDYYKCISSPGYMILNYAMGYGAHTQGAILFTVDMLVDELEVFGNAILLLVFSYVMRFFMDALYPLAADITGGLSVTSVTFNMRSMAGKMRKKVNEAREAMKKDKDKGPPSRNSKGPGGDKGGGGGSGADKGGSGGDSGGSSTPKMG